MTLHFFAMLFLRDCIFCIKAWLEDCVINSSDSLNNRETGGWLMDKRGQRGRWWGLLKMSPRWSCKWQLDKLCSCASYTTVCSKLNKHIIDSNLWLLPRVCFCAHCYKHCDNVNVIYRRLSARFALESCKMRFWVHKA